MDWNCQAAATDAEFAGFTKKGLQPPRRLSELVPIKGKHTAKSKTNNGIDIDILPFLVMLDPFGRIGYGKIGIGFILTDNANSEIGNGIQCVSGGHVFQKPDS